MAANSSSTSNSSLGSVHHPCTGFTDNSIVTAFCAIKLSLLVPLSIFILYLGYQRWRRQRSFNTTSHSDMFTYHLAVFELICSFGIVLYFCSFYLKLQKLLTVGNYFLVINYFGETFFHIITCVERYLAVVHPIIYMRLRNAHGVRIRNISIGCGWLLSFTLGCAAFLDDPFTFATFLFCTTGLSLAVISFCSLRVLRALIRPGPGDGGGDRERVDQSKQRAFFTIMAIMGVLWLWLLGLVVSTALYKSPLLDESVRCVVQATGMWYNLPSSLVLPLLYLHRTNKLSCCFNNDG